MKLLLTLLAACTVLAARAQNFSVYIEDNRYKVSNLPEHYGVRYAAVDEETKKFYIVLKDLNDPFKDTQYRFFYGTRDSLKESKIVKLTTLYSEIQVNVAAGLTVSYPTFALGIPWLDEEDNSLTLISIN